MSLFNAKGIKSAVGNPDSRVFVSIIPFSATMQNLVVSRGAASRIAFSQWKTFGRIFVRVPTGSIEYSGCSYAYESDVNTFRD